MTHARTALLLGMLLVPCHAAASAEQAVFAVVVANNRSIEPDLPSLRFADDDGAKYFELFSALGGKAALLSVLDADTQTRFPEARRRARPPRLAELRTALRETFAAIRIARARGRRTVFYFLYSGHGGVTSGGMGYVHLLDGKLTRTDIFREVIARSPAAVNHVIVDACHAYYLLHAKGAWRDDQAPDHEGGDLLQRFLKNETLERHPNTGVVLATSSSAETHEWSRFQGGIFSHEVRSALAGAADVDGDGAVSYSELAAYVAAANSQVTNQQAHLSIFTRPPAQDMGEPVVRLAGPPAHLLQVARPVKGHFYVEDLRGVRYADFNKSGEQALTLVLPQASRVYYLRGKAGEVRVELKDPPGVIRVDRLDPLTLSARGPMEEALRRGLYAVPYGRGFHEGYLSAWRRSLGEDLRPVPQLRAEALAPTTRWRVGLGYLLTTPVLGRGDLAHGLAVGAQRRVWGPLSVGLEAQYARASDGVVEQHRLAALAGAEARWAPRPYLALTGGLALGYLAILEQGEGELSGDAVAFTLAVGAGAELRLMRWLWLSVGGRLIVDLFSADDGRRTHLAPAAVAGLVTTF